MLDQDRIIKMTKLAIMENHEGEEMMKTVSYRKVDYILTEIFKGFIAGSVCYILALILWFCYLWDDLNDFIVDLNFADLITQIAEYYVLFIVIYLVICTIVAFRRHSKRMGQRYIYLSYLKDIQHSYYVERLSRTGRRNKKKKEAGENR